MKNTPDYLIKNVHSTSPYGQAPSLTCKCQPMVIVYKNDKHTRLLCRGTGCLGFELCSAGPILVARIVFTVFHLFFLFHVQDPRGEETLDQKRVFFIKRKEKERKSFK